MQPLIITSCSNRKRYRVPSSLCARNLPRGNIGQVAEEWLSRTITEEPIDFSQNMYSGRTIREAELAASVFGTKPHVVSAGLGLIPPDRKIPAYDLTLARTSEDCVYKRIIEPVSSWKWWDAITNANKVQGLANCEGTSSGELILLSVPQAYCHMLEAEIRDLPERIRDRIRLFGPQNRMKLPASIRNLVMPYDSRFDGPDSPIPGTKIDFAQRALRHFVSDVLTRQNYTYQPQYHAQAVSHVMSQLTPPIKVSRIQKSDDEIIKLVRNNWNKSEGKSAKMLRVLRDDLLIACEQGRFAQLFKDAKKRYSL